MKRLFLLRHAKSSWDDADLADRDRPLAPRGRRAAGAIARHLRDEEISPSLVLCSPARRTRETLEAVDPSGDVRIEDELYGASEAELLERLRRVPEAIESVMLIGHNPAIQELALGLASRGAAPRGRGAQVPHRRARHPDRARRLDRARSRRRRARGVRQAQGTSLRRGARRGWGRGRVRHASNATTSASPATTPPKTSNVDSRPRGVTRTPASIAGRESEA